MPVSKRNRELVNQLSGTLRIINTKGSNIYIHKHTSMHVGMYDHMRSESESELGNQLSGMLKKASKQTSILVFL
jgi:hypothetical protein